MATRTPTTTTATSSIARDSRNRRATGGRREAPEAGGIALALVTHDSEGDLRRCLGGQLAAAGRIGAPVVAVDNASVDRTVALLEDASRSHPDLTVHEMGRNAGYAAAVNAAFSRAPGRDVMLINPDLELDDPTAVEALAELLAREPTVGVVAPRLVGEDGRPQPSARRFPSLAAMLGSTAAARLAPFLGRSYERFASPSTSDRPRTVDWVIGAAMMIRRAAFDEVGGWDDGYFLYVDDTDFCLRCWRAGWEVAYLPSVSVLHRYPRASSTRRGIASSRARRSHVAGLARLWAREPRLLVGLGGAPTRELRALEP